MSVCIVTILPLSEKQIGKIEPNCEVDFPKSAIGIDFHNDLIESGELDMSSEIKKIAPEEDDKKFIYKQEKNHVVFRIKAKMFEGLDWTKDDIRLGFSIKAKFEREMEYEITVPIFINCGVAKIKQRKG